MKHWQVLKLIAAEFSSEIAQDEICQNKGDLVFKKVEILPQQGPFWWFFSSWQLEVQPGISLFSYQQ
jgi:hypothetical protein